MIDVNGSRYHLILGKGDWEGFDPIPNRSESKWTYDTKREGARLKSALFRFPEYSGHDQLSIDKRRGAAPDPYGNWFWISQDQRQIWVRWTLAAQPEIYWSPADQAPPERPGPFSPEIPPDQPPDERFSGLTVTQDHYLVIGSPLRGELIFFDLHTGGQPLRRRLPAPSDQKHKNQTAHRFDMAPASGCGFLLLDRVEKLVWVYDGTLQPTVYGDGRPAQREPALFQPTDAHAPKREILTATEPQPLELADDVAEPISIESIDQDHFVILDNTNPQASTLYFYNDRDQSMGYFHREVLEKLQEKEAEQQRALATEESTPKPELNIIGHDLAFVAAQTNADERDRPTEGLIGSLYVVRADGNQTFEFTVRYDEEKYKILLVTAYYPLRHYGGRGLVTFSNLRIPFFDFRGADVSLQWLALTELPRRRYVTEARLESPVFDGKMLGCEWHRLCIDGCIPHQTGIEIKTRAADLKRDLPLAPWRSEERLYLRQAGSEIPYGSLLHPSEADRSQTGTWELLFQKLQGRYMQLAITLHGNGRATPQLRAMRIHYPRFSYLKRYLPLVYQRDEISADFLERFLANPEGLLTTLEGLIAQVQVYFDARTAPAGALEWLAGWVGLALDPTWTELQRRRLLENAMYFFQRRGTRLGLIQLVHLALDPDAESIFKDEEDPGCRPVRIIELFETAFYSIAAQGGVEETTSLSGDDLAHRFFVLLPVGITASQVEQIERLVSFEKPAHTHFEVRRYWNMFRVGSIRLGVDTILGDGAYFVPHILGEIGLGEGTLGPSYPDNVRNRLVLRGE